MGGNASKHNVLGSAAHEAAEAQTQVGAEEEDPGEEPAVTVAGAAGAKADSKKSDETATSRRHLSPWYKITKERFSVRFCSS